MSKPRSKSLQHDGITLEDFSLLPSKPTVSICCITYNHENYIRQAINGFLMQITTFPFEILLHDDASTDATTDILYEYQKKYPNLFRLVIQKENRFQKGLKNFSLLFSMATGKYVALCEGDDFWPDPQKLQKQVDFLEQHKDCSICCHKIIIKSDKPESIEHKSPKINGTQIFSKSYLYGNAFIRTCSVLFRNTQISKLIELSDKFVVGDSPLFFYYAQLGDIGFIEDVMAVHLRHSGGFWNSREKIEKVKGTLDTRLRQRKYFHINNSKELNDVIMNYIRILLENPKVSRERKLIIYYLLRKLPFLSLREFLFILKFSITVFLPNLKPIR